MKSPHRSMMSDSATNSCPTSTKSILMTKPLVRNCAMLLLILGYSYMGSSANGNSLVLAFSSNHNAASTRNRVVNRRQLIQPSSPSISSQLRWKPTRGATTTTATTTRTRLLMAPLSSSEADRPNKMEPPIVTSRRPHQLANGRGTFLGFRNVKDLRKQQQQQQQHHSVKALQSSVQALMPDGGLSPCVIRVLGVGGGGCNAVRGAS